MATAGVTDPLAAGHLRAGQDTWPSQLRPQPQSQRSRWTSQSPGPLEVPPTPSALGWPWYPRGQQSPPRGLARCAPFLELNIRPSPGPNLFSLRSRRRKGCGRGTPPWGKQQGLGFLTPAQAQRQREGRWPAVHTPVLRARVRQ
jgi:hypothetical protein